MSRQLGGGPVTAVLFDYGNTLVTFERPDAALVEAYRTIETDLRDRGFDPPPAAVLLRDVHDRVEAVAAAHQRSGALKEINLVETAGVAYAELGLTLETTTLHHVLHIEQMAWWQGVRLDADALPTIDLLRARGLSVGVCSNAPYRVESLVAQLDHIGVRGHVDAVVFSAQVGWRKPALEIFARALAELEAEPETTVMVGDSLCDDIVGGRAAGLRTVLLRREAANAPVGARSDANAVIHRLAELPLLLLGPEGL